MAIPVFHVNAQLKDARGEIARLVDGNIPFREVLRITSKAGTIRSNHYHKNDSHYMYLESGKCEYSEKPVHKKTATIQTVTLVPGDIVLTKPGIIHAVRFLKDSVLYAFTTSSRKQKAYEKDTVRVTIVE